MAVKAVIRIFTGGVRINEARSPGGETVIIHTDSSGKPLPETIDGSGRRSTPSS